MYVPPDDLWPPQRRGLLETITRLEQGIDVCLYSPTGGGKTRIAIELLNWAFSKGWTGRFYVNRRLLLDQTADRFSKARLPFGIRAAGFEDQYDWSAPVQICSADTERSRVYERKIWEPLHSKLVIVDEAHLQKTGVMERILRDHRAEGGRVVLLTATPVAMEKWADELVVSGTLKDYRECKAIVPCIVKSIQQPDLRKVKRNKSGEYIFNGKRRAIYTQSIVGDVLDRWEAYNPDARLTFLYAPGVKESVWFTERFMKRGVNWCHVDATEAVVDGKRTKLTRPVWAEILERLETGDIKGISSRFKCLDSQTEVLTRRGWMGNKEIRDNDTVASMDLDTGKIAWSRPRTIIRQYGTKFCSLKSMSLDIRVTHDHNMVVRSPRCKWKLLEAAELLQKKGAYHIPVAACEDVPGVDLSDAEISLIGWALTDGHIDSGGRLTLCQSTSQPQVIHDHIQNALNGSGVEWTVGEHEARIGDKIYLPARRYRVSRRELERAGLDRYLDKDLPLALLAMSRRQLEVFLEAINYADGYKRKNPSWEPQTLEISKGNRTFLSRLQALCVTRGMRANLHTRKWGAVLYVTPGRTHATVRGTTKKDEVGFSRARVKDDSLSALERTWCVSTKHETIVTRRNGKVAIVGNCREGIDIPSAYHAILATPIGSLMSFIQAIGRVMRYSQETPDHVIVTDHGGCYYHFGSPNHMRPWDEWWGLTERAVSEMRFDGYRNQVVSEPIRCPACETERTRGITCPVCGFAHKKSQRRVIQEDGTMETKEGDLTKPKLVRHKRDTEAIWRGMVLGCHRSGKDCSFKQLEAWFFYYHHYYPPRDIPFMPKRLSDWPRKVHEVPLTQLTGA